MCIRCHIWIEGFSFVWPSIDGSCQLNHHSPIELIECNATSKKTGADFAPKNWQLCFRPKTDLLTQWPIGQEQRQKTFHNLRPSAWQLFTFMLCVVHRLQFGACIKIRKTWQSLSCRTRRDFLWKKPGAENQIIGRAVLSPKLSFHQNMKT